MAQEEVAVGRDEVEAAREVAADLKAAVDRDEAEVGLLVVAVDHAEVARQCQNEAEADQDLVQGKLISFQCRR